MLSARSISIFCCFLTVFVSSVQADITEQRSSSQFNFRYEADSNEPDIENSDDWTVFENKPTVNSVTDGILNCSFGQDRMWMTTETSEAQLDHSAGWTYEVRLRVVSATGSRGAIALSVDDQLSTDGGMNGFQIHADRTQWNIDGDNADQSSNDDTFHVFRLAEEADSNVVHGWRDGIYLGSAVGGHDFSQETLQRYILFGSWSSAIVGTVEIDYVRWDSTGAYAPYSPLQVDTFDGLEVREEQQTSDTYTIGPKMQPTDDVVISISCDPSQLSFGTEAAAAIELTFTSENYSPKTVQINAVDDDLAEGIHSVIITHAVTSNDSRFNEHTEYINADVIDNDVMLVLSGSSGKQVYENGLTSDSYEIHCLQQPDSDIIITVQSDASKQGDSQKLSFGATAASSMVLTFTPVNWQTPKFVTVNATDNTDWNRLRYYPVVHSVQSMDSLFDEYSLGDVSVLVWDDDYAHIMSNGYTIPTVDMDQPHRQVIVDKEEGVYLAHPTTVLLEDGQTILAVYPRGAHARGECVLKRSVDGGLTWGERLGPPGQPEDWVDPGIQEVPTIHRVVDPEGVKRLIIFTGLYPCRMSVSEDDGHTWTPFAPVGDWGGIVTMGFVVRLKDGRYMAMFHDDGRFFPDSPGNMRVYKTLSSDGGLTWSYPEVIIDCTWASPCEPGIVRSPDGNQLVVLMRENSRQYNSLMMTSEDEGLTWSDLRELPASLTGDRHTGQYSPDGRLFISFRDRTHDSPTSGDWVGWVGTYNDIVDLNEGQYRVRVKDNLSGADTAYPGVEILPNGEIVTTTYGWWESDQQPYIVSSRFRLSEIDAEYNGIPYCGQAGTVYLKGDINRDCFVNLLDMLKLMEDWLKCTFLGDPVNCGL